MLLQDSNENEISLKDLYRPSRTKEEHTNRMLTILIVMCIALSLVIVVGELRHNKLIKEYNNVVEEANKCREGEYFIIGDIYERNDSQRNWNYK